MLIHLQYDKVELQQRLFREALQHVPKSGEVWCEGARLRLNPTSPYFNLDKARNYLEFAIQFTPQYGDSFVELCRVQQLQHGPELVSSVVQVRSIAR